MTTYRRVNSGIMVLRASEPKTALAYARRRTSRKLARAGGRAVTLGPVGRILRPDLARTMHGHAHGVENVDRAIPEISRRQQAIGTAALLKPIEPPVERGPQEVFQ
jgi:hypothetical protein